MSIELRQFLLELDEREREGAVAGEDLRHADQFWSRTAGDDELRTLLHELQVRAPFGPQQEVRLAALFRALLERSWDAGTGEGRSLPDWLSTTVAELYRAMGPASGSRAALLQVLATRGDEDLTVLADCLVEDPPLELKSVFIILAPLFQRRDFDPNHLFPRLLDGLAHSRLAASIIDLSNFVVDAGLTTAHPVADRATRMIGLLGELTQRLGAMEERVGRAAGESAQLAISVEDSVALAVALCRALALIRDPAAIGKLYQALELRHRRLRVEAAAALAALGEEAGVDALAGMAREPVVRLRVLSYARELDCLDQIEDQYQTLDAQAEAELAFWLAQPTQAGIPPTRLEVVDQRSLYWPGYNDEVDCCLIRYTYDLADGEFSNIGIVGPLTHAFGVDIADLSPDDIYAAFAGWHAEHEEIYDRDVLELTEAQRVDVSRLERRMHDAGYADVQPIRFGHFFGERTLVARARREGVEGIAVADPDRVDWWSTAGKNRPLTPDVAYCIAKGRKLLRSFNVEG